MTRFISKDEAAGYLAGMIDGEGYVSGHDGQTSHSGRCVEVTNTDMALLWACVDAADLLDLEVTTPRWIPRSLKKAWTDKGRAPYANVRFAGKENLERLLEIVPMRSGVKVRRLNEALANYKFPRIDPEQWSEQRLRDLYEVQQLTVYEIAEVLGRSRVTVTVWLKKYGIRIRTRGESNQIRHEKEAKNVEAAKS